MILQQIESQPPEHDLRCTGGCLFYRSIFQKKAEQGGS